MLFSDKISETFLKKQILNLEEGLKSCHNSGLARSKIQPAPNIKIRGRYAINNETSAILCAFFLSPVCKKYADLNSVFSSRTTLFANNPQYENRNSTIWVIPF